MIVSLLKRMENDKKQVLDRSEDFFYNVREARKRSAGLEE